MSSRDLNGHVMICWCYLADVTCEQNRLYVVSLDGIDGMDRINVERMEQDMMDAKKEQPPGLRYNGKGGKG